MKPSKELAQQWSDAASDHAEKLFPGDEDVSDWIDAQELKFAELAAEWGAQQSQDGKRYRWLRDSEYPEDGMSIQWDSEGTMEEYIDAAMAKEQQ